MDNIDYVYVVYIIHGYANRWLQFWHWSFLCTNWDASSNQASIWNLVAPYFNQNLYLWLCLHG